MSRPSTSAFDRALHRGAVSRSILRSHPGARAPVASLRFALPHSALAVVRVMDGQDREVRVLLDGELDPGEHKCCWDGGDGDGRLVAPGDYTLRLEVDGGVLTSRLVTIR